MTPHIKLLNYRDFKRHACIVWVCGSLNCKLACLNPGSARAICANPLSRESRPGYTPEIYPEIMPHPGNKLCTNRNQLFFIVYFQGKSRTYFNLFSESVRKYTLEITYSWLGITYFQVRDNNSGVYFRGVTWSCSGMPHVWRSVLVGT
jgi:hypothetical protein